MEEKTVEVVEKIRLVPPRIESYSTRMEGASEAVEFKVEPEDGFPKGVWQDEEPSMRKSLNLMNQRLTKMGNAMDETSKIAKKNLHRTNLIMVFLVIFFIIVVVALSMDFVMQIATFQFLDTIHTNEFLHGLN